MKVALLRGASTSFGGQPLAASRLVSLLRPEVELLPIWLDAPDGQGRVEPAGGGLLLAPPRGPGGMGWLAEKLRGLDVEAYHLHGVFEYPLACLTLDRPLVVSFRGSDLNLSVFRRPDELELLLRKARVVTFMNPVQERLARRLFEVSGDTMLVPNHVPEMEIEPAPLFWPRPIFASVAEFRRLTGLDLLLQAFVALGRGTLLLIGPFHPQEASYYDEWVERIPGIVRTGAVSSRRVRELLAGSDLAVFPSVSEGMPNKVMEAMATGTPVLVSDVAGNSQLVDDGRQGRLFPSRDAEALRRVMAEMAGASPEQRQLWVDSARARIRDEFSAEHERAGWLECYRRAGLRAATASCRSGQLR